MITIEQLHVKGFISLIETEIRANYDDPDAKVISITYEPEKNKPLKAGDTWMQSIETTVRINGKQGGMLIGWNADEAEIYAFVPGKDENGEGIDYHNPTL